MVLSKTSPPALDKLVLRLQSIERTRKRVESLLAANHIGIRDMDAIYAGLFTNAITGFEAFIEELFINLLVGSSRYSNSTPRAAFKAHEVARDVILGRDQYVEWLPYERTKDRAVIFFRGGRPFSMLPPLLEEKIRHSSIIRNALVHSSRHAKAKFDQKVINNIMSLAPKERTPIGFLRSQFRISPIQRRFEVYTQAFIDSAKFLSSYRKGSVPPLKPGTSSP